jgi:glutamyl/glutaminyl-tRNA synthetase
LVEVQNDIDKLAISPTGITIPDDVKPYLSGSSLVIEQTDGSAEAVEMAVKNYVAEAGIPFKNIGQNTRLALTGSASAPAIGKLVEILGLDEYAKRIKKAID